MSEGCHGNRLAGYRRIGVCRRGGRVSRPRCVAPPGRQIGRLCRLHRLPRRTGKKRLDFNRSTPQARRRLALQKGRNRRSHERLVWGCLRHYCCCRRYGRIVRLHRRRGPISFGSPARTTIISGVPRLHYGPRTSYPGNFHGWRYGRLSIAPASSSPGHCWVWGSQGIFRPRRMAMLPRWQRLAVR